jgi:hypothetical protein
MLIGSAALGGVTLDGVDGALSAGAQEGLALKNLFAEAAPTEIAENSRHENHGGGNRNFCFLRISSIWSSRAANEGLLPTPLNRHQETVVADSINGVTVASSRRELFPSRALAQMQRRLWSQHSSRSS